MAEIYKNTLCVTAREIIHLDAKSNVGSLTGFVSEANYYRMVRVGHLNVIKRGGPGFSALIEFDSMRRDIRDKYVEVYGDPRKSQDMPGILESTIQHDERAYSYYSAYRYGEDLELALPAEKVEEYTLNARVCNAVIRLKNNKRTLKVGAGNIRIDVWGNLCKLANELRDKPNTIYAHTLPANPARFKAKVKQFEKEGYYCLIHKGFGNKNTAKIDDDQKQALIHKLLSSPNNMDNEQVRMMFNLVADKMGWAKVKSAITIANWRKSYDLTTYAGRRGVQALRNTHTMQVKRSAPKSPLLYWTLDGWDVELLYQKRQLTKDGGYVTTYHNRLTMVVVLDPCNKYPMGYAIGTHESPALIREALTNAIRHTVELFGNRYKPMQLQSDNYQKKLMVPFYEAMSTHYTPAALKNAKSKVVEPYFKYLNKNYCQLMFKDNWSGFGITSRQELQPNTEWLNKVRKDIPDEAGCRQQIITMMEAERAKKREKFMQAWINTPAEDKILFPDAEYLFLMGERSEHCNTITGKGLKITINGQELTYDSFDTRLRNQLNESWVVRYDPEDLSTVLVSNATRTLDNKVKEEIGNLQFMLVSKVIVPMALREQRREHFEYRAEVSKFNKELENNILNKMTAVQETVEELFEANPQLENTLAKLVICDSRGQHKDQRNRIAGRMDEKPAKRVLKVDGSDDDWEFDPNEFLNSF